MAKKKPKKQAKESRKRRPKQAKSTARAKELIIPDSIEESIEEAKSRRLSFLRKLDTAVWVEKRLFPSRLKVLDLVSKSHGAESFIAQVIGMLPPKLNVLDGLPDSADPELLEKLGILAHQKLDVRQGLRFAPIETFLSDLRTYGLREALAYLFEHPQGQLDKNKEAYWMEGYRIIGRKFLEQEDTVRERLRSVPAGSLLGRAIQIDSIMFGGVWEDGQEQSDLGDKKKRKSGTPMPDTFRVQYLMHLGRIIMVAPESAEVVRGVLYENNLVDQICMLLEIKVQEAIDSRKYRHVGLCLRTRCSTPRGLCLEVGVTPSLPQFREHRVSLEYSSYGEYLAGILDLQRGMTQKFVEATSEDEFIRQVMIGHVLYSLEESALRMAVVFNPAEIMVLPEEHERL